MIVFEEALRLLKAAASPLGAEDVGLHDGIGRVLAAPVIAQFTSPPADVSVMDGYAVYERDLATLPTALTIAGESAPGRPLEGPLQPGTSARIFTGAFVPEGADRVVMQELVDRHHEEARIAGPLSSDRFIRAAGSDFADGDMLLEPGTTMTPGALVAAAAGDVARIKVARRPTLCILSTGDELAAPGSARERPYAIPDSLTIGLTALSRHWGAHVDRTVRLSDTLVRLVPAAADALDRADLVVVTGGASVGERDFAKAMFEPLGLDLLFSKVRMKPGKPVWLGRVRGKLVLGLPGNPTSAMVTARLLLAPLLCRLLGRDPDEALRWRDMPLAHPLEGAGDRETFSRAVEDRGSVRLLEQQDSGSQKSLAHATLLVRRPIGTVPTSAGSLVPVLPF